MDDDLKKESSLDVHQGPDYASPYPVSRLAPAIQLVDLARQIGKADQTITIRLNSKLRVIAEQIKDLQEKARQVMEEAQSDQALHRIRCNFKKIPGHIYFLYRKTDGSRYFSMLSQEDWKGRPPHSFEGGFRLENDMSWTPVEGSDRQDDAVNRADPYFGVQE